MIIQDTNGVELGVEYFEEEFNKLGMGKVMLGCDIRLAESVRKDSGLRYNFNVKRKQCVDDFYKTLKSYFKVPEEGDYLPQRVKIIIENIEGW